MKKLFKIEKNKRLARCQAGMTHSINSGLRSETQARRGHPEYSRGMTYVELIVVLSIFAVMSTIVMFSYNKFQAKVDVKNLASDIALKIIEAQKSAVNGVLPFGYTPDVDPWKPSYGIYFNKSLNPDPDNNNTPFNEEFTYFADLDQGGDLDNLEVLNFTKIIKGDTISSIEECDSGGCSSIGGDDLTIIFTRPDSSAVFSSGTSGSDYIQITVESHRSSDIDRKSVV